MDTTTYDVILRVEHIDLDSEETGETLATRFPDVIWEEFDGLVTMTIAVPVDDLMSKTVETCRALEAAIAGAKVTGVHRDLVNTTDIATRVNLSREAVRKWSVRADFPCPLDVVGGDSMKLWAWTQVVQWLRDVRAIHVDETPMSLQEMTHLENCLMRNPDHTSVQWHTVQRGTTMFQPQHPQPVQQPVLVGSAGRGQVRMATSRPVLVGASSPSESVV